MFLAKIIADNASPWVEGKAEYCYTHIHNCTKKKIVNSASAPATTDKTPTLFESC